MWFIEFLNGNNNEKLFGFSVCDHEKNRECNLLKGITNKTKKPIKRVFTYCLFSVAPKRIRKQNGLESHFINTIFSKKS